MATLRDQAISALTNSGASAALTGVGTALGLPAVKAAGAALALADSGAVPAAARRVREGVPSAAKQVREALPFPPEDEDPFAGLDLGEAKDEDPFAGIDLGEEVKPEEPEIAMEMPAPVAEPVTLPGEPADTTDVAAPGGVPVMRWRPWEKVAGAATGVAQSLADVPLAAMTRGEERSAAAEAAERLKQSADITKSSIREVIKQREGQSFSSNLLDDLYDVAAAIPRIGLSTLAEEPADVDQFEQARKAGYQVLPGVVGQVEAMKEDFPGYVRSMPVSTALDLAPLAKGLTKIASPLLPDSRLPAVRLDRARYEVSQRARQAYEQYPEAAQDIADANAVVTEAFRIEDDANKALQEANRQLEELGAFAAYDDVQRAQEQLDAATSAAAAAERNRTEAMLRMMRVEDEVGERMAESKGLAGELLRRRREAPQSPVLEAIGKVLGPERVAGLRRTFTQPSAQSRAVYELAAEEMLRPADIVPSRVVARSDVRRKRIEGEVDGLLDRASRNALTADDLEVLSKSQTFSKTGNIPSKKVLLKEMRSGIDELVELEKAYRESAGEAGIPALTSAVPSGREIRTPPELRKIIDSEMIDPGLVASLMPLVEPPLPNNVFTQVQDVIKGNLTTGSPVSILNNAGSNLLLQTFRRGPAGASLLVPRAMIHTVNMLQPDKVPAAIRDRLAQYDRTYQILDDLKILDRDALTVDANRSGMSKWADTLSKVGTLGDVLPFFYRLGDKMFKLEETVHNLDKYRGYVDSLKPGQFVEFRMTPRHVLRVDNEGGNLVGRVFGAGNLQVGNTLRNFNTSMDKIQPELVRAAAQTGLDAFFDYTDVSNFLKNMRNAPIIGVASPFTTWAYKAMDLPGLKRGLGREALLGMGGVVKTNSGEISTRQAVNSIAQAAGRVAVLDAAHRQLLQDDKGESRKIAQAFSYLPKEPKIQLLRSMTDPRTGGGSGYGYLAQGGNYNFLQPTERLVRLGVWVLNSMENNPEQLRDLGRAVQDSSLPANEKRGATRQLELLYRINSGQVADFSDVAEVFGLGGSSITQIWEKMMDDEQLGRDVRVSDIAADILKAGGFPVNFMAKVAANQFPDSELARPFRDRGRDLVQPDENLRQSVVRPLIKNVLGLAYKFVPLESAVNPNQKDVRGEIDRYFGRIRNELENRTDTKLWRIKELEQEAAALERAGDAEGAQRKLNKANARRELRVILFGRPANAETGEPPVQGEFDVMRENLFNTIDRLRDAPAKSKQPKETP